MLSMQLFPKQKHPCPALGPPAPPTRLHSVAKDEVEKLRKLNASRKLRTEKVMAQLAANRTEELSQQYPTLIRYQSLTYSHVSAMLLREQRAKLKQLLDILPLKITGLKSGGGGPPIQVSICNLKLPDSVSTPLTGCQQPEVSAAGSPKPQNIIQSLYTGMLS